MPTQPRRTCLPDLTMNIDLKLTGFKEVEQQLRALNGQAIRSAAADAINDVAFKVRKAYQVELERVFDRVTPYIKNSIRVERATESNLQAMVQPTYLGGKGIDPSKVLLAEVQGGARRDKRSEVALRRAGILPPGYITTIPRDPFPGSDDGRGNIRGPFMVQLLSYLQAFGEQGYRANMTAKRKSKIADKTVYSSIATKRAVPMIRGYELFVSTGRLRGEDSVGRKNKTRHLEPGIWARSGAFGASIRPVILFVKRGAYRQRLDMDRIITAAEGQQAFESRFRYQIRKRAEALWLN